MRLAVLSTHCCINRSNNRKHGIKVLIFTDIYFPLSAAVRCTLGFTALVASQGCLEVRWHANAILK